MLAVLYSLNLVAAFALTFVPLWFSKRYLKLPWLNPYSIALAVTLPVQLMKLFAGPLLLLEEGGLFDPAYQFAVLMGSLLAVAQATGLVFFFQLFKAMRIEWHLPFQSRSISRKALRRAARLLLLIFAIALLLLASAEFGIQNWLANPREGYQLYRTGQGHWYAIATSTLGASFLLYFLARPQPGAVLMRTLVFLAFGYLLGSKFVLISIFAAGVTYLWFIHWRHLTKFLIFGMPFVFALAIWNLYLGIGADFELLTLVQYFDYYKNAADYYRMYLSGELPLFHGEILWTSLWSYVPRAVWTEKPVVYGVIIINEIFYPGAAELTMTPAFGGAVEQFADFGVIGVLLFGFLGPQALVVALLSYLIFVRPGFNLERMSMGMVAALVVQFAPAYGLYFPGALYVVLLGITMIVIAIGRVGWLPRGSRGVRSGRTRARVP